MNHYLPFVCSIFESRIFETAGKCPLKLSMCVWVCVLSSDQCVWANKHTTTYRIKSRLYLGMCGLVAFELEKQAHLLRNGFHSVPS